MKRSLFIPLMVMTFCFAPSARADIIYTNFAAVSNGWGTVGSSPLETNKARATPFTVGLQDYLFDSAQMYIQFWGASATATTSTIMLALLTSAAGLPGTVLESAELTAPLPGSGLLLTWSSLAHPVLQSGAEYWVTARATNPSSWFAWNMAPGSYTGLQSMDGGPWQLTWQASLEVNGSPVVEPVPEPASLLLFGTGLVGLRAWRKRRG